MDPYLWYLRIYGCSCFSGDLNMDELTQLAIKYGTDKWGKHHYTPVYHEMFNERRGSIKKVLEIGVAEGAGLRMLRDFFPNAMIYGADNDVTRLHREDRIKTFWCDQANREDLEGLIAIIGSDIDIIIEDGSHNPVDQVFTARTIMSMIKTPVVYVIEDVADPSIVNELVKYGAIATEVGSRYDDRLVVLGSRYE